MGVYDDLAAGDDVRDANSLLERNNQLLASLVESEGTVDLPEATQNQPFRYISVADNVGVSHGVTTIDFANGDVTSEREGVVKHIDTLDDISQSLDGGKASLRSLSAYFDQPVDLKIGSRGGKVSVPGGQRIHIPAADFEKVTFDSHTATEFDMVASTRAKPLGIMPSSATSNRLFHYKSTTTSTDAGVFIPPSLRSFLDAWPADKVSYGTVNVHPYARWNCRPYSNLTIRLARVDNSDQSVTAYFYNEFDRDSYIAGEGPMDSQTITTASLASGDEVEVNVNGPIGDIHVQIDQPDIDEIEVNGAAFATTE